MGQQLTRRTDRAGPPGGVDRQRSRGDGGEEVRLRHPSVPGDEQLEGMGKAAAEQVAGLVRRPMPALHTVSDPV